jgi:hypothetical protein
MNKVILRMFVSVLIVALIGGAVWYFFFKKSDLSQEYTTLYSDINDNSPKTDEETPSVYYQYNDGNASNDYKSSSEKLSELRNKTDTDKTKDRSFTYEVLNYSSLNEILVTSRNYINECYSQLNVINNIDKDQASTLKKYVSVLANDYSTLNTKIGDVYVYSTNKSYKQSEYYAMLANLEDKYLAVINDQINIGDVINSTLNKNVYSDNYGTLNINRTLLINAMKIFYNYYLNTSNPVDQAYYTYYSIKNNKFTDSEIAYKTYTYSSTSEEFNGLRLYKGFHNLDVYNLLLHGQNYVDSLPKDNGLKAIGTDALYLINTHTSTLNFNNQESTVYSKLNELLSDKTPYKSGDNGSLFYQVNKNSVAIGNKNSAFKTKYNDFYVAINALLKFDKSKYLNINTNSYYKSDYETKNLQDVETLKTTLTTLNDNLLILNSKTTLDDAKVGQVYSNYSLLVTNLSNIAQNLTDQLSGGIVNREKLNDIFEINSINLANQYYLSKDTDGNVRIFNAMKRLIDRPFTTSMTTDDAIQTIPENKDEDNNKTYDSISFTVSEFYSIMNKIDIYQVFVYGINYAYKEGNGTITVEAKAAFECEYILNKIINQGQENLTLNLKY